MKKKIFLGVLSLMAMTLAACGGSQPSQESQPESTPQSQSEPASQPESEPASEPESQPESQPESEPASEPESQPESEPASEESSEEESSEDTRTPTNEYTLTVGGEGVTLYEDEEYDGTDVWEGIRKFYADPFDVTAGQAIAAKNANDEEVWPNGYNDQNNVAGEALGEFTVIDTAENALFTLYVYDDGGAAYNLTGKAIAPVDPTGEGVLFEFTYNGDIGDKVIFVSGSFDKDWGVQHLLVNTEGNVWTTNIEMDDGDYQCKFILGNADGTGLDWDVLNKSNISFTVPCEKVEGSYTYAGLGLAQFSIEKDCGEGYSVYVLGDWNGWGAGLGDASRLTWGEGNVWTGSIEMEVGTHYFKYVVSETENPTNIQWPEGDNSSVEAVPQN